jgi:hypothetical protein
VSAQLALLSSDDFVYDNPNDCWATPWWFVRRVEALLQVAFTLDVCCHPRTAKAPRYFTAEDDGLLQLWEGTVWCNPPFSKGGSEWNGHQGIAAWAMKARHEADAGRGRTCILAPADVRPDNVRALATRDAYVSVADRVPFDPPPGIEPSTPAFGIALHLFGEWPNPPKYL